MAIALVGTIGAASQGAVSTGVTPAWGTSENRTAGNLLICTVTVTAIATLPTTPSGWSIGKQVAGTSTSATIYYKIAAGADTAPTIAAITSGYIAAQLAEYSGAATSSPLDQSGSATGTSSPITATASGANKTANELMICAGADYRSVARASNDTWTSNDGTVTLSGSNNGTSSVNHYSFGRIVGTTATTAETSVMTLSITSSITGLAVVNASFLLPPITGTGSVALPSANTGSGAEIFGGSGSVASAAVASAGTGAQVFAGSGAVAIPSASAGTGAQVFSGTGAVALPSASAGTGTETFSGSGAVAIGSASSGTSAQVFAGSGAVASAASANAGTGAETFSGTGTVPIGSASSGAGGLTFTGSGDVAQASASSGAGTETFAGSGAVAIASASAGTGSVVAAGEITGAGTVAFAAAIAGAGVVSTAQTGGKHHLPWIIDIPDPEAKRRDRRRKRERERVTAAAQAVITQAMADLLARRLRLAEDEWVMGLTTDAEFARAA